MSDRDMRLAFLRCLVEHGKPFADKRERLFFSKQFYEHIKLTKIGNVKFLISAIYKNIKVFVPSGEQLIQMGKFPSFVKQDTEILELYRHVMQIYSNNLNFEDPDNLKEDSDNPCQLLLLENKTEAVGSMVIPLPKNSVKSVVMRQEIEKMREQILRQKRRAHVAIRMQGKRYQFYSKMKRRLRELEKKYRLM